MIEDRQIAAASAKSRAARARLTATLVDIQSRLRPGVLLREAVEDVRKAGLDLLKAGLTKARDNPGPVLGIGALIAAYVSKDFLIGAAKSDAVEASPAANDPAPVPPEAKAKAKAKSKSKSAKTRGPEDD